MQDTFQWTDELVSDFLKYHFGQFEPLNTSMEQFKSSKSPKKEWEIVEVFCEGSDPVPAYQPEGWTKEWVEGQIKLGGLQIHSVRRLSDSLTFSCQEKVKTPYAGDLVIHSFEIRGQEMIARFTNGHPSNGYCNINGLSKLPQPILVTSDGVEIFPGDKFWVIINWEVDPFSPHEARESDRGWWKDARIYSTEVAANAYILNNKPLLSLNDVKEAFDNVVMGDSARYTAMQKLTALVKQKLNDKNL